MSVYPHLVIEELLDIIKLVMWVIHIYVSVPSLGNWRAIRYYKVSYVSDTHICQRTLPSEGTLTYICITHITNFIISNSSSITKWGYADILYMSAYPHLVIEELLDIIKLVMWVIHIYVSVPSLGNWRAIRYYKVSYVSDTHTLNHS
jgi:hypothetical protein